MQKIYTQIDGPIPVNKCSCGTHANMTGIYEKDWKCPKCRELTETPTEEIRHFPTGAVRGSGGKLDFPEYISGHLLFRYAKYMQKNAVRYGAGNWRKSIPKGEYWRSLTRHYMMLFLEKTEGVTLEPDTDHLAAMIFNIQGLIHEEAKEKLNDSQELYGYPFAMDESKIL